MSGIINFMDNTQKFDGFPIADIGIPFENMFRKLYGNGHPCGKNPQFISLNLFWITGFPMTVSILLKDY